MSTFTIICYYNTVLSLTCLKLTEHVCVASLSGKSRHSLQFFSHLPISHVVNHD